MKNKIRGKAKVNILQITDTHLFASDEQEIFGVKSNLKFREVIKKIVDKEQNIDLIFLTGDISQDESTQSYQKAADILQSLNIPVFWIAGNHDNLSRLEDVFKNSNHFNQVRRLSLSTWNFIFLNTKLDGSTKGHLSTSELQILKHEIQASKPDKDIAIVMHHHPFAVGTPLVDNYILKNKDDFWEIVTGTKVRLIICGHVHGDYRFEHNGINIESSPATCLQWPPGSVNLKIDTAIGYKLYQFGKNHYKASSKIW